MSDVSKYSDLIEVKQTFSKEIAIAESKIKELKDNRELRFKELGVSSIEEVRDRYKVLTEKYDEVLEQAQAFIK